MQLGVNNQNTPGVSFVWQEDSEYIPSQQFVFESVNKTTPYLYIKNVYSGLYLGVYNNSTAENQGLRLYNKDSAADGQKFKITRTTGNYIKIAPKTGESANPDMVLAPKGSGINANLIMQKNVENNSKHEWIFGAFPDYPYTLGISMFYDNAYRIRYGNSNTADTVQLISELVGFADSKLFELYGLKLHYNAPTLYTTLPEQCIIARGLTLNSSTINQTNPCPANPSVGSTCPNHSHNADITHNDGTVECTNCTSKYAFQRQFTNAHPGTKTSVNVLFTGNLLFSESGTVYNRSYSFINEGEYSISMQKLHENNLYNIKASAELLHEISHIIGAPDHYHELVNGICKNREYCNDTYCQGSSGRPTTCLMGRTDTRDFYYAEAEDIYCTGCYNDIITNLQQYNRIVIWG